MYEFAKETNQETAVVVSFIDEQTGKRIVMVRGTEDLRNNINDNMDGIIASLDQQQQDITANDQTENQCVKLPSIVELYGKPLSSLSRADLRRLVPLLVKNTIDRSEPLWGNQNEAPVWWPTEIPYTNPRRRPKLKHGSWTEILRIAALACYIYYDKEDLTGNYNFYSFL